MQHINPLDAQQLAARKTAAFELRQDAAADNDRLFRPDHQTNGDEQRYAEKNYFASYGKGLLQNEFGEPDAAAYRGLLKALRTGQFAQFDTVELGGGSKLDSPFAGYMYALDGRDYWSYCVPPAPRFDSAEYAAEMAEVYWTALTRDCPVARFDSDNLVAAAIEDLSKFSGYKGPKKNGAIAPTDFLKMGLPGENVGPYVSQFFLLDVPNPPFGSLAAKVKGTAAGRDFLTDYDDWVVVQGGGAAKGKAENATTASYILTTRTLADVTEPGGMTAWLLATLRRLWKFGAPARNPALPFAKSKVLGPRFNFDEVDYAELLTRVISGAARASTFQKWLVHRRLKTDTFGGRLHNHLLRKKEYPINSDLLNSAVLKQVYDRYGTYLLPSARPRGSGHSPSYPTDSVTMIAAGATILKAYFQESFVLPEAVVPAEDGQSVKPLQMELTVGGELNKLVANAAAARVASGAHVRSDVMQSVWLGEAYAIDMMRERKHLYREPIDDLKFTKFDGTAVAV